MIIAYTPISCYGHGEIYQPRITSQIKPCLGKISLSLRFKIMIVVRQFLGLIAISLNN